ncbi:MAG: hypothetical protein WBC21_02060 [Minisyncoccales bacterium]
MKSILTIIAIIIVLIVIIACEQGPKDRLADFGLANILQSQESVSPKQASEKKSLEKTPEPTEKDKTEEPPIFINTYITAGPEQGEIIEGTDRITFEFEAKIYPEENKERIFFETKVEGLDDDWKKTYSQKRTVKFPPGYQEYTFLVRAKIQDSAKITSAKRTFIINNSPYFGKIKISNVKTETSSSPSLITLRTYLQQDEKINITDWQIKGKKGKFLITQGIEKFHPNYQKPIENIMIKKGDKIYLSGSQNPFGRNKNFRTNKCLGYFINYRSFPIPISKNCPKPEKEEIFFLSPCCKEFILELGRCEIPNYSNNLRISVDSECVSYLVDNLNYAGCYRNYSKDEDFLENNWHIYLNRNIVVSNDWDTFYLRDENGLFVDKYSYGYPACK